MSVHVWKRQHGSPQPTTMKRTRPSNSKNKNSNSQTTTLATTTPSLCWRDCCLPHTQFTPKRWRAWWGVVKSCPGCFFCCPSWRTNNSVKQPPLPPPPPPTPSCLPFHWCSSVGRGTCWRRCWRLRPCCAKSKVSLCLPSGCCTTCWWPPPTTFIIVVPCHPRRRHHRLRRLLQWCNGSSE
jgi:hypothetical protein